MPKTLSALAIPTGWLIDTLTVQLASKRRHSGHSISLRLVSILQRSIIEGGVACKGEARLLTIPPNTSMGLRQERHDPNPGLSDYSAPREGVENTGGLTRKGEKRLVFPSNPMRIKDPLPRPGDIVGDTPYLMEPCYTIAQKKISRTMYCGRCSQH
jgi:hypothetical protein